MMVYPAMLVEAAKKAGIKTPKDPDDFNKEKYPHFSIFCAVQLGCRLPRWGVHWTNAKVIAKVPPSKIKSITMADLIALGYEA